MVDGSKTGWIAKYGVPSLVVSMAVLVLQQQQQTFDRLQRILESGYQFYSTGRTALQFSGDGNRELSLLKIIGNAFPNVFCDVRQDMYERASKAETPGGEDRDGRKLIDSLEIRALYEGLADAIRPRRKEAADSVIGAWSSALPWASRESKACPSLSNPSTEAQLVAETPPEVVLADADEPAAAPTPAPVTTSAPEEAAGPDLSAKSGSRAETASPRDDQPTSSAPPGSVSPAPSPAETAAILAMPELTAVGKPVRVFFHIPADSPLGRDAEILEGPRSELASYNYQIARSVERVPLKRFPGRAEIRYFGPDQAAAAEQLKAYLDREFSAEGLEFRTREIGAEVKGFPPQNLEVWVPNPAPVQ